MEAENPEPPNTEEPPKPKEGRPAGSKNRKVNEAKDAVAEATIPHEESSEESKDGGRTATPPEADTPPAQPEIPVVVKKPRKAKQSLPKTETVPATPAPPNAEQIAEALLTAWHTRKPNARESQRAIYASWF